MNIQMHINMRDEYLHWLAERMLIEDLPNGWFEYTLPYMDRHRDYIEVYVRWTGDHAEITDAGYTLADLQASGWEPNTELRQDLLQDITRRFQLEMKDDELRTTTTAKDFPRSLHNMAHALLTMNNLIFTSRRRVIQLFREDVRSWVQDLKLPYQPNQRIEGATLSHTVDFLIEQSNGTPARLLRTFTELDRRVVEGMIFSRLDTIEHHPNWKWIVIVDDKEARPSNQHVQALLRNNVGFIPWSKHAQQSYKEMLIASHSQ